jgi:hypothetical protein
MASESTPLHDLRIFLFVLFKKRQRVLVFLRVLVIIPNENELFWVGIAFAKVVSVAVVVGGTEFGWGTAKVPGSCGDSKPKCLGRKSPRR